MAEKCCCTELLQQQLIETEIKCEVTKQYHTSRTPGYVISHYTENIINTISIIIITRHVKR